MKVGDLILDNTDGEVGLVVAIGSGIHTSDYVNYPDGLEPSWKVDWPSMPGLCDTGQDELRYGDVEVISKA